MQNKPSYPITSVDHALRLMLMLREDRPLRASEAAEELGVARSTAHRLFDMLCYRGFAVQNADKRYVPGPSLWRAPTGCDMRQRLRTIARPHLEQLNQELDETVHLMVRDGAEVVFLDSVETRRVLRVGSRAGARRPAHRTSGGKALLAELSRCDLHTLYAEGLPTDLPAQLRDIDGFHLALAAVRQRGYGLNVGESEPGVTAVGVCVKGTAGTALGALALSAPTLRMPRGRVPEIAECLAEQARAMEADLAALGI
ncbi:IclR family transcriptional regulator [Streptomyces werraensis]|uniref:IclR family transcriptional regulator n=1 Tax=Streptomyces werraensis TaxID=68284 RepID=UPI001CE29631